MPSEISINGVTYTGDNIELKEDGTIIVDGVEQPDKLFGIVKVIIEKTDGQPLNLSSGAEMVVHGDVHGNADAGHSLSCGNIGGSVSAGTSIKCADIAGKASAGASIKAASIGGNVSAGGSVHCTDINGAVTAGGSVKMSR